MKNKRCPHDWYHLGTVFEGVARGKAVDVLLDWAGYYVCGRCLLKRRERPKGSVKGMTLVNFWKRLKEMKDGNRD